MPQLSQISTESFQNAILGGTIGAIFGGAIVFIFIAVWVYSALAWVVIGRKLGYKYSWLAWIPFARTAMIFQLGKFHFALAFLWLIPVLGWLAIFILGLIASWRIFEKRNYPGWLALIPIITIVPTFGFAAYIIYLIILGFVAWKDKIEGIRLSH